MSSSTRGRISGTRFTSSQPRRLAWYPSQTGKRKKLSSMHAIGEQQVLRQIEQDLRDADRGFAWRLTLLQGLLRRAGPGRRAYLLVLAALKSTLLRLVAAAGRLLMTFAAGAVLMDPAALAALADAGWPGWEPGQASRHSAVPARDRPRPGEPGPR